MVVDPAVPKTSELLHRASRDAGHTDIHRNTHRAVEETYPRSLGTSGFGLPPSGRLACALGGREP